MEFCRARVDTSDSPDTTPGRAVRPRPRKRISRGGTRVASGPRGDPRRRAAAAIASVTARSRAITQCDGRPGNGLVSVRTGIRVFRGDPGNDRSFGAGRRQVSSTDAFARFGHYRILYVQYLHRITRTLYSCKGLRCPRCPEVPSGSSVSSRCYGVCIVFKERSVKRRECVRGYCTKDISC